MLREGAGGAALSLSKGEGRYSLHDLLRDFALERSNEEERETASQRHAAHYMHVLSTANDLYLKGGENILAGLSLFDREAEHIKTGQAWAAKKHARLCKDYPSAGAYVLDLRLTPGENISWLETALASARRSKDRSSEGNALGNLGNAYADLGEARKAIEFYEQALIIAREIGDKRNEGNWLGNLGNALHGLGEKERGLALVKQALAIFEAIESPHAKWARDKLKEWGA